MGFGEFIAVAIAGIFVFCLDVARRLIAFFEKVGIRKIVDDLNTALRLIDMATSQGMLDSDASKAWRATMKQLNSLQYKQRLLLGGENFLYNNAVKMESDMEERLTPESECCLM